MTPVSGTDAAMGGGSASHARGPADGNWDGAGVPERLRELPSRMLGHASVWAERLVGDALATAGARKWHYALLVALQETGPGSQSGLSRRTGIYSSDLVAVINELVEQGFVERSPDPADRRRNIVTITAQGRRRLRRLDKIIATAQDELLAPLSPRQRDDLTQSLRCLLDHHAARRAP